MITTQVESIWRGKEVKIAGKRAVGKSAFEIGLIVEGQAKTLAPVDTGRLAGSITTQAIDHGTEPESPASGGDKIHAPTDENEVLVGTAVDYGCVLGGHAVVWTRKGTRTIGKVAVGDEVLTATGEYHMVERTVRFPVTEKPEMVTLRAAWRRGKFHELTVTADHKVAVLRNQRYVWIPAAEIEPGDCVFRRRKRSHSTGTGRVLVCQWCGIMATGKQGKRFCSIACRDAAWSAGINPHVGAKRSPAARARMSAAAKGRSVNHLASYHRHHGGTRIERDVAVWLDGRGVLYEPQKELARNVFVDFWLPATREVIEADGAYWHRNQERDMARDRVILAAEPDAQVTHLHFYDRRWTPPLDPTPMPQVRYMVVNPAAKSFVETDEYEPVAVEVRRWRWQRSLKKHASAVPMLYDLTVEGVHSFVANGLLISNSHVEFGTMRSNAQPFLRPSLDLAKGQAVTVALRNGRYELKDYLR